MLLFPAVPIVFGPLVVIHMHSTMLDDPPSMWGKPSKGFGVAIYILLLHMQSMSAIKLCDLRFPAQVQQTWAVFDLFNSLTSFFHLECLGVRDFKTDFGIQIAMPGGVLLIFLGTALVSRLCAPLLQRLPETPAL